MGIRQWAEGPPCSTMAPLLAILFLLSLAQALPLPQDEDAPPPMPYQFSNTVSEANTELEDEPGIYWTQQETAEESNPGRVEGEYSVWLADGRLMTVSYYVDGDSGFVPTITYTDSYTPQFE